MNTYRTMGAENCRAAVAWDPPFSALTWRGCVPVQVPSRAPLPDSITHPLSVHFPDTPVRMRDQSVGTTLLRSVSPLLSLLSQTQMNVASRAFRDPCPENIYPF